MQDFGYTTNIVFHRPTLLADKSLMNQLCNYDAEMDGVIAFTDQGPDHGRIHLHLPCQRLSDETVERHCQLLDELTRVASESFNVRLDTSAGVFRRQLGPVHTGVGAWQNQHDPIAGKLVYDIEANTVELVACDHANWRWAVDPQQLGWMVLEAFIHASFDHFETLETLPLALDGELVVNVDAHHALELVLLAADLSQTPSTYWQRRLEGFCQNLGEGMDLVSDWVGEHHEHYQFSDISQGGVVTLAPGTSAALA